MGIKIRVAWSKNREIYYLQLWAQVGTKRYFSTTLDLNEEALSMLKYQIERAEDARHSNT